MPVKGAVPRNLLQYIASLFTGQQSSTDSPGQVLQSVLLAVGGLTTAGSALGSSTAQSVTWIAIGNGTQAFSGGLTTLAAEVARVPVVGITGTGAAAFVTGVLSAAKGNCWISELGVFGGTATSAANSGTLYAYCLVFPANLKTASKIMAVQWMIGSAAPARGGGLFLLLHNSS